MNNKIISLSKVFLKSGVQELKIFKKNKKITSSNLFWLIIMLAIAIAFVSYKGVEIFKKIGQPQMFLNMYLVIMTIFLQIQIILITLNILFFTKDLEYVLPMPISGREILLAKYITITVMAYVFELIFLLTPMVIYGMLTQIPWIYFITMPIVLLIFPLFFVTITSILTIILMSIFKFVKNENLGQLIVYSLLIYIVLILETTMMIGYRKNISNRINVEEIPKWEIENSANIESNEKVNTEQKEEKETKEMYEAVAKGYIVVNPTIAILSNPNNITNLIENFGKLIIYNAIPLAILLLIGKKMYIKTVLTLISANTKKRKDKKIKKEIKIKQKGIARAYIEKDIKQLLRNQTFFMQLVFPIITIFLIMQVAVNGIIPVLEELIQSDETIKEAIASIPITTKTVNIILCVIQVLISIPAISLTAISREGKSAIFMKYAPISFHKQFLYKNAIQLIVNFIITVAVLVITYSLLPNIDMVQAILLFITATLISLINSYAMLMVDVKRPQLNWDSEYEVTKNNPNKIYQYVFMILMVLVLLYISKVLEEIAITKFLIIQTIIFTIIFSIFELWIRNKK